MNLRSSPHSRQHACPCMLCLAVGWRWQVAGCLPSAPHGRQQTGPGAKLPGNCGRQHLGRVRGGAEARSRRWRAPQLRWHGNGELPCGTPWEKYSAATESQQGLPGSCLPLVWSWTHRLGQSGAVGGAACRPYGTDLSVPRHYFPLSNMLRCWFFNSSKIFYVRVVINILSLQVIEDLHFSFTKMDSLGSLLALR